MYGIYLSGYGQGQKYEQLIFFLLETDLRWTALLQCQVLKFGSFDQAFYHIKESFALFSLVGNDITGAHIECHD